MLEVLAGDDGFDPRQKGYEVKPYTEALIGHAEGMKIGIVTEGFGWEGLSEEDVDQFVREAAYSLKQAGATVEEVSIPMHRDGIHLWNAIGIEGATSLMVEGNALGTNWKGHYSTKLADAYGKARKTRADEYPATVIMAMLAGQYMHEQYNGKYYAKAQNLVPKLKQAYDEVLNEYDVLIMPTTPMKARKIPGPDASIAEVVVAGLEVINNTGAFDVTGHPAINVPCGKSEGLPVGMMIIGKHGEDDTVLRVAHAYQCIHTGTGVTV